MAIQSINPFNSALLTEVEEHGDAQINQVLERAQETFERWRKTDFRRREELMKQCANELRINKRKYAELITEEMGKVVTESLAEIEKCAWVCDYNAETAGQFLRNEPLDVEEGEAYVAYDPIGPVLAIMPWNFPFWQVFRFAAPNIMAGNTGVLKHASNVPQCALAIQEIFLKAGFPEGVFQSLFVGSQKIEQVIEHPAIKAVTLTGSDRAGRKVAEQAGRNIKKTVLELGGSDPFIILKDADIEQAAKTAVKARMINCGQSCIAAKRFIVEKPVADKFLEYFEQGFEELKFGDPMDEESDYGPMARKDLASSLEEQVMKSVEKGAKIVYGEGRAQDEIFFHPTIITNIKPGMPAYDQELFGPVAILFVAEDETDAIRIANNSPYGLGASLWTRDIDKAHRLAREIESGSVFINSLVASHPKAPFGGVKSSGYGRELSFTGIKEFMNIKTVWIK